MSNTFWMYDVTQLFRSFNLLPTPEDSLATKLNTIMRLTILICAVIGFFKPILAFSTIVVVMAVTMSVFAGATKQPIQESFEDYLPRENQDLITPREVIQLNEFMREYRRTADAYNPADDDIRAQMGWGRRGDIVEGFPITQKRFCNDDVPFQYGPDYISANQQLAGGPNMRTTVPPLIAPPSHDLNAWKENDFVTHSNINRETNFDYSRSGYNYGVLPTKCFGSQTCEGPGDLRSQRPKSCVNCEKRNNCSAQGLKHSNTENSAIKPTSVSSVKRLPDIIRDLRRQNVGEEEILKMTAGSNSNSKVSNSNIQARSIKYDEAKKDCDGRLGATGPDREIKISPCFENPRRDNIITQTLQPGVYQKSHVGEPIQSNIGISYIQEFVPTEVQSTPNRIKYTQQNPKDLIITPSSKEEIIDQTVDNIYDPRFYGYGTSYRSYVDKLTGRPRFYYDDIDSITMPNYITRSKVDVFPWANTYGPDKIMSCDVNEEHRQLANNSFHESALQFRTEMQERLMRKRNAEMWQRRIAPITTMSR